MIVHRNRTIGGFAALAERDVASRFGRDTILAHRLARGLSERPPPHRHPPAELSVAETFDPPLERVDAAAFAAKSLGEQLHARLGGQELACTRLSIIATTEHGQTYSNPVGIALPIMNVEPKKVTGRCPQVGQPAGRHPTRAADHAHQC
jgi:protein ImuB